jgi:hypothetical protein
MCVGFFVCTFLKNTQRQKSSGVKFGGWGSAGLEKYGEYNKVT